MKLFSIMFIAYAFFATITNINAQGNNEGLEIFDDSFWDEKLDDDFEMEHPLIELTYELIQPSLHKDVFASSFGQLGGITGKFGYVDINQNLFESNVFEYKLESFTLGYSSPDLNYINELNPGKIGLSMWHFGYTEIEGYGHQFTEKTNLLFFTTTSLIWKGIEYDSIPTLSDSMNADKKLLDRFADGVRFSDKFEGGIKFQIYKPFAITVAYQRQIIYPRVLFWKLVGSDILSVLGEGIISHFTEKIIESAPTFGPFFHFVLINAYKYGTYELRKKRMNWPFASETPMINDGFNVGMTFTF